MPQEKIDLAGPLIKIHSVSDHKAVKLSSVHQDAPGKRSFGSLSNLRGWIPEG